MRQSSDVKSSLGEEVGGGGAGGRGWVGRKATETTNSAGKKRKAMSKIAREYQEQGKKPLGGLLEVPSDLACPGNQTAACSCWLATHVSLVAGKAAPASRPAPVSPFLCSPTSTTGKPRATPYSFLSNYGSGRHSTSPAVSNPSSQPLISTFLTIFHPSHQPSSDLQRTAHRSQRTAT